MRLENNTENLQLALESSDATANEVDEIIAKLLSIKEGMQGVEKQSLVNRTNKKSAIRQLGDESVTISFKDKPHKKFHRPPKYQYLDNGVMKTWWGGGKMPNALRSAITNADGVEDRALLEQYLIPKEAGHYQYKDREGNTCFWNGEGETPKDLQILLNNGMDLAQFDNRLDAKPKPVITHSKGAIYEFQNKKGFMERWNPETDDMPLELLEKITIMGQPRPELLKKYLQV